jgi:hypothetical protein
MYWLIKINLQLLTRTLHKSSYLEARNKMSLVFDIKNKMLTYLIYLKSTLPFQYSYFHHTFVLQYSDSLKDASLWHGSYHVEKGRRKIFDML